MQRSFDELPFRRLQLELPDAQTRHRRLMVLRCRRFERRRRRGMGRRSRRAAAVVCVGGRGNAERRVGPVGVIALAADQIAGEGRHEDQPLVHGGSIPQTGDPVHVSSAPAGRHAAFARRGSSTRREGATRLVRVAAALRAGCGGSTRSPIARPPAVVTPAARHRSGRGAPPEPTGTGVRRCRLRNAARGRGSGGIQLGLACGPCVHQNALQIQHLRRLVSALGATYSRSRSVSVAAPRGEV